MNYIIKLEPIHNIIYDKENDTYRVIANPARFKIVFNSFDTIHFGWFLLSGTISRKAGYLKLRLIFNSNVNQSVEELPVSCKGTILEIIKIPKNTQEILLELDPMNSKVEFKIPDEFYLKPLSFFEKTYRMIKRVIFFLKNKYSAERKILKLFWFTPIINLRKAYKLSNQLRDCFSEIDYSKWIENIEMLSKKDEKLICKDIRKSGLNFNFIIIIAASKYDTEIKKTILSLERQLYKNFLIFFIYENSLEIKTKIESPFLHIIHSESLQQCLKEIEKISPKNCYFIILKEGITLPPHALYWFAKEAQATEADMLYSDHDYLGSDGKRINPQFKPDFSIEHLRSTNYINYAFAVKYNIIEKIKGFKNDEIIGYNLHSLILRIIENIEINKIKHIPAILFNIPENIMKENALYTQNNAINPVKEHLSRVGVNADVERIDLQNYKIIYKISRETLISIIISTKNQVYFLEKCIESILKKSTYRHYEIIIVDNQSNELETLKYLDKLSENPKIKVLKYDHPFNFSAINNFAVNKAEGEVLVFLNNDTEVITNEWLEIMLGCLQQPDVGAVGVKLYYEDRTIQHAGVIIGLSGCADHLFKGLYDKADYGFLNRAIILQEYSAVTAACMMTWKSTFLSVGGFDEINLAINFNDVDYCLKLRELGIRIIFTPFAELFHYESQSRGKDDSPKKIERSKKEADYIRKKWQKFIENDPFYNPNLSYRRTDFSLSIAPKSKKVCQRKD